MSDNLLLEATRPTPAADAGTTPIDMAGGDSLRRLGRQMLMQAAAGNADGASHCLQQLFALRGRFPGFAVYREVATGRLPVQEQGPVFVQGSAPLPDLLRQQFDEAIQHCRQLLQRPAPTILLQCRAEQQDVHLALEAFPGLTLMRLSTLSPDYPLGLRDTLFHEVTHSFLTCGVRLLDEGLAHHVASQAAGASLPPAQPELLPPLRRLLSRSADAMFGETTDSDLRVYQSACAVGAELVAELLERQGSAGLCRLYEQISQAVSDAEIVALVEAALGRSLPRVLSKAPLTADQQALVDRAREAMFAAWASKQPSELEPVITALAEQDYHSLPGLLDSLLCARIQHALLRAHNGDKLPRDEEAGIDLLLQEADCLPAGRLWLWRGCRAVLAIALARPNLVKVAAAGQQAVAAFNRAAELIPDDPDLLVQHATLLLNAPEAYGGNRDFGVAKLRQAMQDPRYHHHAQRVLARYGIETPEARTADTIAPPPPSPHPVNDAPVAIQIDGIQLKLSAAFTLAPGPLTVRRGERLALVGRNGSGKTLLLETLLGLRQPDRGQIRLEFASTAPGGDRRHLLGGLLQGGDLPGQSKVREIMAMHQVMYPRSDAEVTRALGLDELKEREWDVLSRGQKQRVMLWLALAHLPEIALLDEPTLGLDEWFVRAVRELWQQLPMTLVIISHHPTDLVGMQRIVCMNEGKIVDEGSLPELVERYAGRFKGQILQPLPAAAAEAMNQLPGLLHPPQPTPRGWLLQGGDGFDQSFRQFIDRHGVSAFSLEAASTEDFLARVAQD